MADVLALLREYHLNGKAVVETQSEIIFGDFAWPKIAKTNFLVWGSGKDGTAKDYYTLDCVVYFLKHLELPHTQYVRQAASAGVPVVRLPDRRDLLAYLKGETNTAPNIDRAAPVDISLRRPVVKKQSADLISHLRRDGTELDATDSFGPDADAKRARLLVSNTETLDSSTTQLQNKTVPVDDETIAREKRLLAAKLETFSNRTSSYIQPEQVKTSSLPESIPLDKIQTWRAKFRAIQQQRIKTDDIDQVLEASMASSQASDHLLSSSGGIVGVRGTRPGLHGTTLSGEQQTIIRIDDAIHTQPFSESSIPRAALAADQAAVRPILAREHRWRTRVSVLQSQGKTFYENIVLGILRNVLLKEDSGSYPQIVNKLGYQTMAAQLAPGFPQPLAVGSSYPKPVPGSTNYTNTGSAMAISTGQPGMSVGNSAVPQHPHPQMHYSRYDQERFASGREETAGFRIDTMATYHGKALASMVTGGGSTTPGPAGDAPSTGGRQSLLRSSMVGSDISLPTQDTPIPRDPRGLGTGVPMTPSATPDAYRGLRSITDARLAARYKARSARIPIIIIPAAPTSLITMYNARDILQELSFVTSQEKQASGVRRENEILIHRQKSDGRSVPYRVIDQPNKLQPEEWNRVVAVFVQGQTWQFKGWPIGSDPAVIFSLVKGFHLKYTSMPLDANVAKWNVRVINLDQRRHLDKANFQQIWDQLDKHIAKCKPFLRA